MKRLRIKLAGESGAGLLSTGDIVINALRRLGFYIVADREYPSLIMGGHSCYMINASREKIHALCEDFEVLLALDKSAIEAYFGGLKKGGILIHGYERLDGIKSFTEEAGVQGVEIINVAARQMAKEQGGNSLMTNMVLAGLLWGVLDLDYEVLKAEVEKKFASKPALLAIDLRCTKAGYEAAKGGARRAESLFAEAANSARPAEENLILMDGNKAIALGAVQAGCKAYFAYPMSPSSSILTHLANWQSKTSMVVKQCEDEITVANMTLGAMYMGTRSMAGTSGGGFDLMTETVSLAGIIETPMLIALAQRPGPATGLPTWTGQGDFNLAVYSAHGEFAKIVVAASDPTDCFYLTQEAFNFAEEFQVPTILLTEKQIAETNVTVPMFEEGKIEIKRGLVEGAALKKLSNSDRYKITENGLSKRWLPGSSDAYYFANGDEHWEDGSLTEDADKAKLMYEKRIKKLDLIEKALPKPEIFGEKKGAEISFIGFGSSKNVMRDVIKKFADDGVKVNYLHFSFVFPLKKGFVEKFFEENQNVHLIEGNYLGQFGNFIEQQTGVKFTGRLTKWNGRPFWAEEVTKYILNNS